MKRTIARFKDVAYSGSFRQDGHLLVAGGQNGVVQVRALLAEHSLQLQWSADPSRRMQASMACSTQNTLLHCCFTQVFDANSRSVLRQLKGHQRPVHVTRFAPDKTHVMSGGDDVTLRLWDISSGKQVLRLTGHEDYVRAAAVSPSSGDTWASGTWTWSLS